MFKTCLSDLKDKVAWYVALGIIAQGFSVIGIVLFQKILDQTTGSGEFARLTSLVLVYGALLGGSTLVNYLQEYPAAVLSTGITEKMKILALEKISKIEYQSYQEIGTGNMIKVIENGAAAASSMVFSFFLRTLAELLPGLVFSLVFIGLYNVKTMMVISAGYIVILVMNNVLLKLLYRLKTSILVSQENFSRYSVRGFMELVTFRTNGRYGKELDRLQQTANHIINKDAKLRMAHESFFAIFALLIVIIKVLVLIYGIRRVLEGHGTIGITVALVMFIDNVYSPVAVFNVLYVNYRLDRVTYQRFADFVNSPEDKNLDSGRHINAVRGEIELKDVSFSIGDTPILNHVSFRIKEGTSVAVVGRSGSGKSTIAKLVVGLLKKDSGQILIDGTDIDLIRLDSLYDHLSYFPQDPPIFDATIRENIVLDKSLPDSEIDIILEKVHLRQKVLAMPSGLDTLVGEKGIKLSGGERQRLAFARVIAQNRQIILLDEPVSALDTKIESSVMEFVLNTFHGRTLIIIAHRLNSIKNVDQILVLKDGQIVEEGNFAKLMAKNGYFRDLWNHRDFVSESS